MIDLSILVCSVHTRYNTFLPKIQEQLFTQFNDLNEADQERTEIVVLTDNKKMMLGHKRNVMIGMAQGKYIVFVDDDDRIAPDYIQSLLDATESDADSIVFQAEVSLNGETPKLCYYSKDVGKDYNTSDSYYRIPNHICCVKKEVSLKSSFPNVLYGEDSGYSKILLPNLDTEHKINKVLYYYDYNAETTETQQWMNNQIDARKESPVVDVVILSKANDRRGYRMTQQAVDTCFYGSNGLPVNIMVMENGNAPGYRRASTARKPGEFNYNAFANYGAEHGSAEWIVISNNDLIFRDGWLHYLISAGNDVVSPYDPNDPRQAAITENEVGYECGKHFSGWCFMIKRSLWEDIGGFDTDVTFWCSDDAVIEQVLAKGITPMLVKDAIVEHNPSTTLRTLPTSEQEELTWRNVYVFNTKYGKSKFTDHPEYQRWLRRNVR